MSVDWEAIYSHGRTTEKFLINSLPFSHCMYICFSASKMHSLLLNIMFYDIRNCSAKFRLFAFYRKKILKDDIFSCKELEVLEAKRKCRIT